MDSVNFEKLCNNIRLYIQNEKPITMEPVVTNGELNSLDLRHFGWNIGTRLGYKGDSKAYFIKKCIPRRTKTSVIIHTTTNSETRWQMLHQNQYT